MDMPYLPDPTHAFSNEGGLDIGDGQRGKLKAALRTKDLRDDYKPLRTTTVEDAISDLEGLDKCQDMYDPGRLRPYRCVCMPMAFVLAAPV
jgi:hypothetical protein